MVELDLLRYGVLPATAGLRHGFAAVRQSDDLWSFIQSEILPVDLTRAALLDLVGEVCFAVDVADDDDRPDFVFCMIADS